MPDATGGQPLTGKPGRRSLSASLLPAILDGIGRNPNDPLSLCFGRNAPKCECHTPIFY